MRLAIIGIIYLITTIIAIFISHFCRDMQVAKRSKEIEKRILNDLEGPVLPQSQEPLTATERVKAE